MAVLTPSPAGTCRTIRSELMSATPPRTSRVVGPLGPAGLRAPTPLKPPRRPAVQRLSGGFPDWLPIIDEAPGCRPQTERCRFGAAFPTRDRGSMSYGSYDGRQPGTTEAREAARERAKEIRDQQRKKDRRSRTIRNGSIIAGTIAVVAIVAFVLTNFATAPSRGPLNMASDGIKIGEGLTAVRTSGVAPDAVPAASAKNPENVIDIRIYVDYLCPNCGTFEQKNSDQLETLLKKGAITLEIHPIALLTTKSAGDQYSLRAANAAACVAEFSPDHFFKFHDMLFVGQPKEGEVGFDDAELIDRAQRAGATNIAKIGECVKDLRFSNWVK